MNKVARIPARMTVEQFRAWRPPAERQDHRWQLFDDEPRGMSPAGITHGIIQSEAAFLLISHLRATRPACRVVTAPGVIPHARPGHNMRVPHIGVTCAPSVGDTSITDPVLLIEILSPSNEGNTRANVAAYRSIPSVQDIVLLASTSVGAELLIRDADGNWPAGPFVVGADDELRLPSIRFAAPLRAFYVGTNLR